MNNRLAMEVCEHLMQDLETMLGAVDELDSLEEDLEIQTNLIADYISDGENVFKEMFPLVKNTAFFDETRRAVLGELCAKCEHLGSLFASFARVLRLALYFADEAEPKKGGALEASS